ncbi:MAG: aldo/keto reductase, partial [Candidatus Heimdallarchaeota archaeon]|nr:aldo/keto reductase [Candidatus Heimdallarchaeota archaeon]
GLGTWMLKPQDARFSTIQAIKLGYRFVDTAQAYRNEKAVGEGIAEAINSGMVKREELIVATKVFPVSSRPKAARRAIYKSQKSLNLEYIDLMYVHYPAFVLGYSHKKTLGVFSELVDEGVINNIGVSNFTIKMMNDAIESCDKPIFANQIEHHPYLQQKELMEFLKQKGIALISYSPLGRGKVLDNPLIKNIAEKNKISTAQVCLSWLMSKGAYPIPKATSLEHLKDNFAASKLILPPEDIQQIDKISISQRYIHPPFVSPKEWSK